MRGPIVDFLVADHARSESSFGPYRPRFRGCASCGAWL